MTGTTGAASAAPSPAVLALRAELPGGRWYGVEVRRGIFERDAIDVLVGRGYIERAHWTHLPIPLYDERVAVALGHYLFAALRSGAVEHAQHEVDQIARFMTERPAWKDARLP